MTWADIDSEENDRATAEYRDMLARTEVASSRQIMALCSFEECIVVGCRLEYGHDGRHDFGTAAVGAFADDCWPEEGEA